MQANSTQTSTYASTCIDLRPAARSELARNFLPCSPRPFLTLFNWARQGEKRRVQFCSTVTLGKSDLPLEDSMRNARELRDRFSEDKVFFILASSPHYQCGLQ